MQRIIFIVLDPTCQSRKGDHILSTSDISSLIVFKENARHCETTETRSILPLTAYLPESDDSDFDRIGRGTRNRRRKNNYHVGRANHSITRKFGDTHVYFLNNEKSHFTRFCPLVARTWHACKNNYHRRYR